MAAGTLFCLIICSLIYTCSAQTKITTEVGYDVILPCKVPNENKTITAVKWIRPDQDSEYVLLYRDGRLDPDSQHPSYQNRVDLQDKEMKDGDVSLILKDVIMKDTGTYECHVFQRGNRRKRSSLKTKSTYTTFLEVLPPGKLDEITGDKVGITRGHHGLVECVILLLLAVFASVGFLILRNHRRQNHKHPSSY